MNEKISSLVADFLVMYVKLHNIHWHTRGPHFFQVHKMTENLYDEFADYYDELSERLIAIGGKPPVTMKESLLFSSIKEDSRRMFSCKEGIDVVLKDVNILIEKIQEILKEKVDFVTEDLLISLLKNFEKNKWIFESTLETFQ